VTYIDGRIHNNTILLWSTNQVLKLPPEINIPEPAVLYNFPPRVVFGMIGMMEGIVD
jgi:hypothetical protein